MREYSLIVNSNHMTELLEALRSHQVAAENAAGTSEKVLFICADLVRRAEFLCAVIEAGDDLDAAEKAYKDYLMHGDAPGGATVTIKQRPL